MGKGAIDSGADCERERERKKKLKKKTISAF